MPWPDLLNSIQINFAKGLNQLFPSSTGRIRTEVADIITPPKLTELAQKMLISRYESFTKDEFLEDDLNHCDQ